MALKKKEAGESTLWNSKDFSDGLDRCWEAGKLRLWIRKTGDAWECAADYGELPADPPRFGETGAIPEDLPRDRYVAGSGSFLEVVPVLPDRSLVLRPGPALHILGGSDAGFYLHIPVWLRVAAVTGSRRFVLGEYPTERLSSTWFGDMKTGELCYSWKEPLYPLPFAPPDNPALAVCPLTIRNTSRTTLDFQRFCVRCEHLALYAGGPRLYTGGIVVTYSGDDQESQVAFSQKPPETGEPLSVISGAREPYSNSLLKKSFGFLRTLTDV